ncbi:prestin-like [Thrips palmi]|uniref:Prestin-like n=1 Tax=Thrips palmi TaxID=161013 RepID=A0A6P8YVF3_THRPL|nr:prestin-like [Thrips palmi]
MDEGNKNECPLESEALVGDGLSTPAAIVRNSVHNGGRAKPSRRSDFDQLYLYSKPKKPGFFERVSRTSKGCDFRGGAVSLFPILDWLYNYKWKSDTIYDLISGTTVSIMHIPHGIAYAMLAGVPPVVGIYMAFFPVFIYTLMGTSRHLSIGTFSVVCMMTSKAVLMYSDTESLGIGSNSSAVVLDTGENHTSLTPTQVAAAVCFVVGFWQVVMGIFKMGVLSVLLSETLVSGFTTGAAVHVITSQISKFFGLKLPRRTGPLKILFVYYDLFAHILEANLAAVGISVVTIIILCIWNELLKPRVEKKLPVPIPIELFAIIIGTLVSYLADFEHVYKVKTIGHVSTGLPLPELPPLWLFPNLLVDGLVICLVAFSINMSMAKILARKAGNYSVSANQELLAGGCANLFGSMFGCVPTAASLSRSMIQLKVGGKTQLASFFSCLILLFVLLFVGPLFQPLPNCVLASIVVVALKGMMMQVKDLFHAWRHSHADALVWLGSFLGVVLLDIDYGLGLGVSFSLLTLVIRGQKPILRVLGNVPGTQIYLDVKCYHSAVEIPGIRIVQIAGGLNFANNDYFQHKILSLIEKKASYDKQNASSPVQTIISPNTQSKPLCLILDMVSVSFVDPSAVKALLSLHKDVKNQGRILCLSNCSWNVFESLNKCGFFEDFSDSYLFSSVHDAVSFISRQSVAL